jgi:tetratricopeptide (TPR) repeat protein
MKSLSSSRFLLNKTDMNYIKLLLMASVIFSLHACHTGSENKAEAIAAGDTSAAGKKITELTSLIQANPQKPDLLFQRSKLYIAQHNFDAASADIYKAVQMDSTVADYYVVLSDVQLAANKPSQAKKSLEKCLMIEPEHIEGNMKLAELYFIAHDYHNVFDHLNIILHKQINNPRAYMMKGMAYKEMQDTAKAISSFQTAIEQDPKYYAPFMQLGILYSMEGNQLAEQYFSGALNIDPRSEEALYGRAMFYQEVKHDYDKAIQDYTSILQINPKNKNAHFNLGFVHYEYLKVPDQAIKHYTDAINADPYYVEAYYNRGLAYESVGNLGAAKMDYEQAIKIRPDYPLAAAGLERVTH